MKNKQETAIYVRGRCIHLFLCGVRVLCSFMWCACVVLFCQLQAPGRAAQRTCRQAPSEESNELRVSSSIAAGFFFRLVKYIIL
jgi:hypothetical protein